jgi:hypothetical protein
MGNMTPEQSALEGRAEFYRLLPERDPDLRILSAHQLIDSPLEEGEEE